MPVSGKNFRTVPERPRASGKMPTYHIHRSPTPPVQQKWIDHAISALDSIRNSLHKSMQIATPSYLAANALQSELTRVPLSYRRNPCVDINARIEWWNLWPSSPPSHRLPLFVLVPVLSAFPSLPRLSSTSSLVVLPDLASGFLY